MIPVTIRTEPLPPKEARRIKCFHCGDLLATRHNATKQYCLDCEHEVFNARTRAHYHVKKAIKAGRLLPANRYSCVDCDKTAFCFDHRDYSKPLAVEPVCRSCNNKRGPARL